MIDAGRTVFLWFWALCMALVEIEIEGPRGWALGLPTWFRTRGRRRGSTGSSPPAGR